MMLEIILQVIVLSSKAILVLWRESQNFHYVEHFVTLKRCFEHSNLLMAEQNLQ